MKPFRITIMLSLCLFCSGSLKAQITPHEAVAKMKKGINLGNTLEPPDEGGWNNSPACEYYFDLYKQAGFDVVRVPVRWDEHTSDLAPYYVDKAWMDRVEEVIDWGLSRDLFIVLNTHHEEWIKAGYSNAGYRARFDSLWSQISVRFREKSEKLIFEILNEPHGLTRAQNDEVHQRILNIIRKTNPTRNVIIQGHNWGGSDELISMAIPDDEYLIGSFHTYDPWPFGLEGSGAFGPTEISALNDKFQSVRDWSEANNIPAFLGEFGCNKAAEYNRRMFHYRTYMELVQRFGFAFCAWDDGGDFRIMERQSSGWNEIKDILIYTTAEAPANLDISLLQDTIIQLKWANRVHDHDSIIIERRTSLSGFSRYAVLPPDSTRFLDANVISNIYYYYRIIAHYNDSTDIFSQAVRIFMPKYVQQERGLFLGAPLQIPGIIEAEHFDSGGEGIGYHDADKLNITGEFRPDEGVDIYDRLGMGYHIGNALPGEWYEYTVDVAQGGEYFLDVHLATIKGGGKFLVTIGEASTDTLEAVNSGSWLTTAKVSTKLLLTTGIQVMRFTVIDKPLYNFDRMEFTLIPTSTGNPKESGGLKIYQDLQRQLVIRDQTGKGIRLTRIFDTTGRLVQTLETSHSPSFVTLDPMDPGIYIIQVLSGDCVNSQKIRLTP